MVENEKDDGCFVMIWIIILAFTLMITLKATNARFEKLQNRIEKLEKQNQ